MHRLLFVFGLATIVSLPSKAQAEPTNDDAEPVRIPLEQIWAYDMPGTRPLSAASKGGKYVSPEGPLVYDILRRYDIALTEKVPGPAFAIKGSGRDAVKELHDFFVKGKGPITTFPGNSEVSIFFFTYPTAGYYVYIRSVERKGSTLEITYQFYPHLTRDATAHFALIPMGKLPQGKYEVKIIQDKIHERFKQLNVKPPDPKTVSQLICKDFSFTVADDDTQ